MTPTRSNRFTKIAAVSALAIGLLAPGLAAARPVTLTTQLKSYNGNGAYVAIYVTDAQGNYKTSLWLASTKAKYHKHLRDWFRATGGRPAEISGTTGASVGSGRTLKVTVDLADALIDAGYQIRVDTAVEEVRDNPADVVVALTSGGAGKAVAGKGFVQSFKYDM